MKKYILLLLCVALWDFSNAQISNKVPADVEIILKKSGKNRGEIEEAIHYFQKKNEPYQLKACYFLISNLDIHCYISYAWFNNENKKMFEYKRSVYGSYEEAVKTLKKLQLEHPGLKVKIGFFKDIDDIKGTYIINNIEQAFKVWDVGSKVSFDDFCEYILPFQANEEPLEEWRELYHKEFKQFNPLSTSKSTVKILSDLSSYITNNSTSTDQQLGPIALGANDLLKLRNARGRCEDMANFAILILRSQGIPISLDYVPFWATSTDSHLINTVFDSKIGEIKLDVGSTDPVNGKLLREPSKVIRFTYSKQPNILANLEKQENIPPGFLRNFNYIDVTSRYWETSDLKCSLTTIPSYPTPPIAYISVFNGSKWHVTWWAKNNKAGAVFNNMPKGVVYLPQYFLNHRMIPAAYPIAQGYNHQSILKPDYSNKRTIKIVEQEKFLHFKNGSKYSLYFWDNQWKLLAEKKAAMGNSMEFKDVPLNALLLLRPDYSENKERPFTITESGQRVWW